MAAESGGLRLVATDSYRLSVRDLPGTSVLQEGQTVLVPSRALAELNRVVSGADQVTLRLASDEASFEVGESRLTTRLIGPTSRYAVRTLQASGLIRIEARGMTVLDLDGLRNFAGV